MNRHQLLLASLVFPTWIFCQSNTVTTGGTAIGSGGSSSYSIGQVDYISSIGSGGEINQGNQQPYEFYLLNELTEAQNNISINIGPNPTIDEINLIFNGEFHSGYSFELLDEMGRLILDRQKLFKEQKIQMTQIASGKYFLNIYLDNDQLKSYQLIKTN
jgi:hypothetical protein